MIKLFIEVGTLPVPQGFTGTTNNVYILGMIGVFTAAMMVYLLEDATVNIVGFKTKFMNGVNSRSFTLPIRHTPVYRYDV